MTSTEETSLMENGRRTETEEKPPTFLLDKWNRQDPFLDRRTDFFVRFAVRFVPSRGAMHRQTELKNHFGSSGCFNRVVHKRLNRRNQILKLFVSNPYSRILDQLPQ